jgi:transcriptional regulator with XRE-family HTH domain
MRARESLQYLPGFGVRLADRLRAMGLSQSSLAKKAKVSRQTLYRAIHHDELTSRVAKALAGIVGTDLFSPPVGPSSADVSTTLGFARTEVGTKQPSPPSLDTPKSRVDQEPTLPLSPLGYVLELMRKDLGDPQQLMANVAGISLRTYRRIISGISKPKDAWLLRWGELAELRDPERMMILKDFKISEDPLHRALGKHLHSWRVTSGLDLLDVSDAIGVEAVDLAMLEVGHDESLIYLDDLAPLYGTTSDVIFRAARLVAPSEGDWRPPVERVLTFESAQRNAAGAQKQRDRDRVEGEWDFEIASELAFIRARAGLSVSEMAKRLKVSSRTIELWEEGDREPKQGDFERMAVLYRSTPWELRYGKAWARALAFPNAPESRSLIFAAILPREDRAWLYSFLAELARIGLDDTELEDVRESLTNPDFYYDVQFARSPSESMLFLRAKLRERAEETWRNITSPGWVEQQSEAIANLPRLFNDSIFNAKEAAELVYELGGRRAKAAAHRFSKTAAEDKPGIDTPAGQKLETDNLYVTPAPFLTNPFSYYRPRLTEAPMGDHQSTAEVTNPDSQDATQSK